MATRIELQSFLEELLGSRNVYYDPPSNIRMSYPAIVYQHSKFQPVHAENSVYYLKTAYDLTLIDKDPEDAFIFVKKLIAVPYFTHDRAFVSDNLHHHVFTIYW